MFLFAHMPLERTRMLYTASCCFIGVLVCFRAMSPCRQSWGLLFILLPAQGVALITIKIAEKCLLETTDNQAQPNHARYWSIQASFWLSNNQQPINQYLMNRKISTTEVPAFLLHAKGPNKGHLQQNLLQLEDVELVCGAIHPLCANIVYIQTNRVTGKQQWTTISRNDWRKARNQHGSLAYYHRKRKASKSSKKI